MTVVLRQHGDRSAARTSVRPACSSTSGSPCLGLGNVHAQATGLDEAVLDTFLQETAAARTRERTMRTAAMP